jgi:hypothetical protein
VKREEGEDEDEKKQREREFKLKVREIQTRPTSGDLVHPGFG